MEISQVARTCAKSRGDPVAAGRRRPGANQGLDGPWAGDVRSLRLNFGHICLDTAPEARERGPTHAGPRPNPRHRGVAPREGWPMLIRDWTDPGRAELGRPGLIWATSYSRLPLRWGGRGSTQAGPSWNPWHGGVAPCESLHGLMRVWTAAERVELGRPSLIWATSVSRLPLRRGGRGPAPTGP